MKRLQSEGGSTLILVVGVVATLAILSSAMVALAVNVQHNTMTDRMQTTAFTVAEAGVDTMQSVLWRTWPSTQALRDGLQVPTSVAGGSLTWAVYDDDGLTPPGIRRTYTFDQNLNGVVWIESRGVYGQRAAKVMVCVRQVPTSLNILGNVAIYTQSDMTLNGAGSQPVVAFEGGATGASVYVRGHLTWNGSTDLATGVVLNPDTTMTIPDIVPDETLLALIRTAEAAGKRYVNQAAVPAAAWSSSPRVIVINQGNVDLKAIPNTDTPGSGGTLTTIWSEANPGVLILLNTAGKVYVSGNSVIGYGIVYSLGNIDFSGNPTWHGMVLGSGTSVLSGTRAVVYNPNVIANLNQPIILSVQQVANTWRELKP